MDHGQTVRDPIFYNSTSPQTFTRRTEYTDWIMPTMSYGARWRAHRRVFHHELLPNNIVQYQGFQRRMARQLLRSLLDEPHAFTKHIESYVLSESFLILWLNGAYHRTFAGTALRVAYGLDLAGSEAYIAMLRQLLDTGSALSLPGKYLVEAIPALQYVPTWFPGAGFKREALRANVVIRDYIIHLFQAGKDKLVSWHSTEHSIHS